MRDAFPLRRITDADRHTENVQPRPCRTGQKLRFIPVTVGNAVQLHDIFHGIRAETALAVIHRNPGFHSHPEVGERASEAARLRHVFRIEITATHDHGMFIRLDQRQERADIFGKMLSVGIKRDHIVRSERSKIFRRPPDRRAFSAVRLIAKHRHTGGRIKRRQIRIRAAVVHDKHIRQLPQTLPHDRMNGHRIIIDGNHTPDFLHSAPFPVSFR